MISVLIITKNEELNLPRSLASVSWSDDIHVFDSISTDRTELVARRCGATFHSRPFDGYASQRNAALREVSFKHNWVLLLDADEVVTAELAGEIARFVRTASAQTVAARLRRRDYFRGRWLRHAAITQYFVRLVRPEAVYYEREINEVLQVNGEIANLDSPLDHYPFSKGLAHWIDKHNRYSSMEADVFLLERNGGHRTLAALARASLASTDFSTKRRHQKALFYALPARPLLKFAYMMFVRHAWLDGGPGVTYAILQCTYEHWIVLKAREKRQGDRA